MPFPLGLNCFARPSQKQPRSKIGSCKLAKKVLKTPFSFIKNCFTAHSSEPATDADKTALSENHVNTFNTSQPIPNAAPAQEAASTVTASSVHTIRDITTSGHDNETTTESVYALTITTASIENSASVIISAQATVSSGALNTESLPVSSETNYSGTTVNTAVSDEDLIVTFDSNASSIIRFVNSIGPSVASSSSIDVISTPFVADTDAVSSVEASAIDGGIDATFNLTSPLNRETSADTSNYIGDQSTKLTSVQLQHSPS